MWQGKSVFVCAFVVLCSVQFTTAILQNTSETGQLNVSAILNLLGRCESLTNIRSDRDKLFKRGCFCDENCARYGDCCIDSPFFNQTQHFEPNSPKCISKVLYNHYDEKRTVHGLPVGIYQIATCPPTWNNEEIRYNCENNATDAIGDMLVASQSQTIYKNIYCALCNDVDKFTVVKNSTLLPQCVPDVIETCANDWMDDEFRYYCKIYTTIVYSKGQVFKNPFCAICNHDKSFFSPQAYTVKLENIENGNSLRQRMFTPLSTLFKRNSYRTSVLWFDLFDARANRSNRDVSNSKTIDENIVASKIIADKTCLTLANFTGKDTQCDGNFDQTFRMKCETGNFSGKCKIYEIDLYMSYTTYTGLTVSIVFLVLHLSVFFVGATSRTLADKNLASYSFALAMAYICFMIGQLLDGYACFVVSLLTYYFFLVSFLWLFTMSFDVWRTTCLVKTKLRPPSKRRNITFVVFSVWNWSFPCATAFFLNYMETSLPRGVAENFRPDFASSACWFGEGDALLLYFALPVTVVMVLNILFFCSTTYMIYSSKTKKTGGDKQYLLCCGRLTVMMGLNWVLGLLASYADRTGIWYTFILFNSLQGFFLFLSFTCKRRIFAALGTRHLKITRPYSAPLISSRSSENSNHSRTKRGSNSSHTTDTFS